MRTIITSIIKEHSMTEKRHITIDDLFKVAILNSPEISPDGKRIVFSYKWTDIKENTYHSNLYMADLDSGKVSQFTWGDRSDLYPLWSPDASSIIFRSDRDKKKGLWIIDAGGGEARPLITEKGSLGEYIWSPDSQKIAYTFRLPDPPMPLEHISGDPEYIRKDEDRPYDVIETIPYKTKGGEIRPKGKFHIYLLDLRSGEKIQLTEGDFDESSISFSPDGKKIAFCSNWDLDPVHEHESNDIYILDIETKKAGKITCQWGPKSGLGWTDDGEHIYYSGHLAPKGKGGPEDQKLYRISSKGGEAVLLSRDFCGHVGNMLIGDTREFDDMVQPPMQLDGGRTLVFAASYHGGCYLYQIPSQGGSPEKIEDGQVDISYYSIDAAKENMAVLKGDFLSPNEIYHYRRQGKGWEIKKITSYNDFLKEETTVTVPEEIWFKSTEGIDIQGWMLKPPDFQAGKKYPLIHQIHGGPHILYGYTFFHEMQYMASKGYCVLFINPRGSRGYGTEFTAPVNGSWGCADTRDQMEFLDHVISLGYVDDSQLFLTGGSYGGYMTNWLVTQTTRYCAAASHRSIAHLASTFGTSCGCYHFEHAFGGVPWEDYEHLRKHSPLFHVKNVETPLLIMHSENDNLTPLAEAEQFFVALRYLGKKVRFVRFKSETHELSRGGRPTNRRARLDLVMDWFEIFRKKQC